MLKAYFIEIRLQAQNLATPPGMIGPLALLLTTKTQ